VTSRAGVTSKMVWFAYRVIGDRRSLGTTIRTVSVRPSAVRPVIMVTSSARALLDRNLPMPSSMPKSMVGDGSAT
jgi:hypothetical protein